MLSSPSQTTILRSPQWDALEKAAQLLEAHATIKMLEERLSKTENDKVQHIELEKNVETYKTQYESEKQKNSLLYKQLKHISNKHDELTETITELKETIESQRHAYEKKLLAMQFQCQSLEIELDETKNEKNSLAETYTAEINKLSSELQMAYNELEMSKEQVTLLTEQVQELTRCAQLAETFHGELLATQQKLKNMEDKLSSQQEASVLARTMYSELKRLPELEKENANLMEENQILRESGNRTLLLQEQLATMNEKYKLLEQSYQELLALQSEHETTRMSLRAWEAIADKGKSSPSEISQKIAQLQKNELQLTEKVGELTSNIHALEAVKQKLEARNKSFASEIDTLKQKNEDHVASIRRLQKRLLLIIKERDSYKRVIESYEHEVTVNVAATQHDHIRSLEETIEGYQTLVQKLENDIKEMQSKHDANRLQEPSASSGDKLDERSSDVRQLKNQINKQQEHIAQLEKDKNLLLQELEMQKGSEPEKEFKVLHFTGNPFDKAVQQRIQDVQKLKEENQMLKTRIKILEEAKSNPDNVTEQVQMELEKAASLPSIESLQEQLTSAETKNKRLMEAFKKTSKEFREACYMLTGYKIDIQPQKKYKLSHMYAESSDDYLLFEQMAGSGFHLLETAYSHKVADLINTYLHGHDSIPAFLSSITLDLFSRQTLISMDTSQN